jgi:cellulose synthase/poly-beta-1,6-N-acetylglucosamine synthase-like glycosyltransferase
MIKNMSTLSVIIICKNEEKHIQACLESVKFADEIIIVDSQSTDNTIKIAAQYTTNIFITPDWPGYGEQKTAPLKKHQVNGYCLLMRMRESQKHSNEIS